MIYYVIAIGVVSGALWYFDLFMPIASACFGVLGLISGFVALVDIKDGFEPIKR